MLRGKGLPQTIWKREGESANPYGGLRLKIEPTVVNVTIDVPTDFHAPRARMQSPSGPAPNGHMGAGAPSGAHVEGSVTPPSPFHHSPQMGSMGGNGDGHASFRLPPIMCNAPGRHF